MKSIQTMSNLLDRPYKINKELDKYENELFSNEKVILLNRTIETIGLPDGSELKKR